MHLNLFESGEGVCEDDIKALDFMGNSIIYFFKCTIDVDPISAVLNFTLLPLD